MMKNLLRYAIVAGSIAKLTKEVSPKVIENIAK